MPLLLKGERAQQPVKRQAGDEALTAGANVHPQT